MIAIIKTEAQRQIKENLDRGGFGCMIKKKMCFRRGNARDQDFFQFYLQSTQMQIQNESDAGAAMFIQNITFFKC